MDVGMILARGKQTGVFLVVDIFCSSPPPLFLLLGLLASETAPG